MPKSLHETGPQQQPQFGMDMTDEAVVTLTTDLMTGVQTFHDVGSMLVTSLTVGASPLHLPGGLEGMSLSYVGDGVQKQDGSIDYETLNYSLFGTKGSATVELAHGALLPAKFHQLQIAFDAHGISGISGELDVSVQIGNKTVGELDISVQHARADIGYTPTGLTLTGGQVHATFVPLG